MPVCMADRSRKLFHIELKPYLSSISFGGHANIFSQLAGKYLQFMTQ
jgi:hypothetical protein